MTPLRPARGLRDELPEQIGFVTTVAKAAPKPRNERVLACACGAWLVVRQGKLLRFNPPSISFHREDGKLVAKGRCQRCSADFVLPDIEKEVVPDISPGIVPT